MSNETDETIDITDDVADRASTPVDFPEADQTEDHDDSRATGNREAAKYRTRLRETEAERDTATQQLQAAQHALVEHLAEQDRVKPAALWAGGVTMEDLLTEDGAVDPAAVTRACTRVSEALGLARTPRPDPTQGSSRSPAQSGGIGGFTDALRAR